MPSFCRLLGLYPLGNFFYRAICMVDHIGKTDFEQDPKSVSLPSLTICFGLPNFLPKVYRLNTSQEGGTQPCEQETAKKVWTYSTSTFGPAAA